MKVDDATLVSQGGSRYRTVLVPATHYMPIETMEHLVRLARAGATIAFYRGLPADVAGLHELEGHRARLRAIVAELKFTPSADGAVKRAPLGRGAVLVGDDLGSLLGAAGARHEPAAALDLQLVRRRERDGYTYFIVNTSGRTVDGWVPLATTAKSAVVYAAMHASSRPGSNPRRGERDRGLSPVPGERVAHRAHLRSRGERHAVAVHRDRRRTGDAARRLAARLHQTAARPFPRRCATRRSAPGPSFRVTT